MPRTKGASSTSKKGSKSQTIVEDELSETNNQKKKVLRSQKNLAKFYLTDYMKKIIKVKDSKKNKFLCDLCPDKPELSKKNVLRHFLKSETHDLSIVKKEDIDGHYILIPLIKEKQELNKIKYGKKKPDTKQEVRDYLQFIGFCEKQNFSFRQISAIGKYLKQLVEQGRVSFFKGNTFERSEISLIARCYGRYLLDNIKQDLIKSPFSFTIDSSTVAKKNIVALKVRYMKETLDSKGFKKSYLQNKVVGIRYLKESSSAQVMHQATKQTILSLDEDIPTNLVGYVHDHASNLSGPYNGLGALLRKDFKKSGQYFMDLKDPCHSLNLVLNQSLDILPAEITEFVSNIHRHFVPAQRLAFLNNLQIENKLAILCPKRYVETRWLSLGESLARLLTIWPSLIKYMKEKPSFVSITKQKYEEFSKLLENKMFRLQIVFLSSIIGRINKVNAKLQGQTLEIQNLKITVNNLVQDIAKLFIKPNCIPVMLYDLKGDEDKTISIQEDNLLQCDDFIETLITDLDVRLSELKKFSPTEREKFTQTFRPYLAQILGLLLFYLPLKDELIDVLDFVSLTSSELKKKILLFNERFKITPFAQINELCEEIAKVEKEDIVFLKKKTKDSSLALWDLIQETTEETPDGENPYKHLSKIMEVAHVLPTSSAGVEQIFSSLKLIRSSLRSNLRQETVQSLLLISDAFKDESPEIPNEMVKLFTEAKEKMNKKKEKNMPVMVNLISEQNTSSQEASNSVNSQLNSILTSSSKKRKEVSEPEEIKEVIGPLKLVKHPLTETELDSEEEFPEPSDYTDSDEDDEFEYYDDSDEEGEEDEEDEEEDIEESKEEHLDEEFVIEKEK